jgi:hypothetical protein
MKRFILLILIFGFICFSLMAQVEEEIFVEGTNMILRYSLSNNLNEIQRAINNRVGVTINLSEATWRLNPDLSNSVKVLMNKHNMNYSMTTWTESIYRYVIVNRRVGNNWFFAQYVYYN